MSAASRNRLQPPPRGERLPGGQRRALIVQAALEVFAEHSFGTASLGEIARRAGVTKPLLYRHFASKADIYVELVTREAQALLTRVRAASSVESDPDAGLRAGVEAFFAHVEERPFARRLLFRDPETESGVAAVQDRAQRDLTRALADLLAANRRLLAGDPQRELTIELFAQLLKTALNGVAAWWLANPGTPRETVVERTLQLLGPGLRALEEPM